MFLMIKVLYEKAYPAAQWSIGYQMEKVLDLILTGHLTQC